MNTLYMYNDLSFVLNEALLSQTKVLWIDQDESYILLIKQLRHVYKRLIIRDGDNPTRTAAPTHETTAQTPKKKAESLVITCYRSPDHALAHLHALNAIDPVDILIMDLNVMHAMDSLEFLHTILEEKRNITIGVMSTQEQALRYKLAIDLLRLNDSYFIKEKYAHPAGILHILKLLGDRHAAKQVNTLCGGINSLLLNRLLDDLKRKMNNA